MSTPQEQAEAHADLLMSTGMAYEITPHTIAYRAFLDGFTAGAASNTDTKRSELVELLRLIVTDYACMADLLFGEDANQVLAKDGSFKSAVEAINRINADKRRPKL